jgi:Holliday junction resolvase-like predicted endonuclease
MTGVSRFSGLSIFSGLNNLNDITMDYKYLSICGYTQEELEANFKEHIEETGKYLNISYDETLNTIKRWYNGYSWDGKTFVYNPFSTLMFLDKKELKEYWYKTGTPTFLIEQIIKKNGLDTLIGQGTVIISSLSDVDYDRASSIDLLFQTGYLTIKKKIITDGSPLYALDFPNTEVREAFLSNLLVVYANKESHVIEDINKRVKQALKEKDGEGLQKSLTVLFANIPYDLITGRESYYHALFLLTARLSGFEVEGEVHTDKGRIDVVLRKDNSVIVVEIKYAKEKTTVKMIKEAIKQIRNIKYYEKYGSRNVSLLAIAFGDNKKIACRFEKV